MARSRHIIRLPKLVKQGANTAKANPLLACGKDRLFMSLALPSNLGYLLQSEQRWSNLEYRPMLDDITIPQLESKSK